VVVDVVAARVLAAEGERVALGAVGGGGGHWVLEWGNPGLQAYLCLDWRGGWLGGGLRSARSAKEQMLEKIARRC
jgi:hypothetical protein